MLAAIVVGVSLGWWLGERPSIDNWLNVPERAGAAEVPPAAPAAAGSTRSAPDGATVVTDDHDAAAARAEQILIGNPRDSGALSALADARVGQGRPDAAIEALFQILDYPDDLSVIEVTNARLAELIAQKVAALAEQAGPAAVAEFFLELSRRAPANDRYRLERARWQAAAGAIARAEETLATVGLAGVGPEEIEALRAELTLPDSIGVRREGRRIMATTNVGAQSVTMLVDTGATQTGFNASVLDRIGAIRLPQRVRVMTAGGVIDAGVYLVRDFRVGPQQFDELRVIELRHEIGGADGILGMDVLEVVGIPR